MYVVLWAAFWLEEHNHYGVLLMTMQVNLVKLWSLSALRSTQLTWSTRRFTYIYHMILLI